MEMAMELGEAGSCSGSGSGCAGEERGCQADGHAIVRIVKE